MSCAFQPVIVFGIEGRFDSEVIHFRSRRDHEDIFKDQVGVITQVGNGHFYDIGVDGAFNRTITPNSISEGQGDGIFQPGEAVAELELGNGQCRLIIEER